MFCELRLDVPGDPFISHRGTIRRIPEQAWSGILVYVPDEIDYPANFSGQVCEMFLESGVRGVVCEKTNQLMPGAFFELRFIEDLLPETGSRRKFSLFPCWWSLHPPLDLAGCVGQIFFYLRTDDLCIFPGLVGQYVVHLV